jgi:tripartite ATP-independent transporter DctM subunit
MLIGVPIAFVLGLSSLAYLVFIGGIPFGVIGVRMFSGVNTFVLLALPFFILAGSLMNKTRITEDLVAFADLLVGRLPGSLAQVNILVSILFAGLSGAAVADTAAIGSILIPAMKKQGYSAEYSAAVTTTSSIIGPIIPPSIIMVIYGSVTGMSVGALFLAGFIPGLLVGLGLMIVATYYAIKEKHPRRTEPFGAARAKLVIQRAIIGLLLPIIIIGGILSGVFTPTEAAAMAVFYALVVGTVVLRTLKLKDILDSLLESAVMASVILLVISAASLFGVVLTIERVPETVAAFITGIAPNKYMFLLLVNLFLLFMGMIMETGANVIILAPILLPVAMKFGIHPLHFALVMLVNVNIGLTTPPLGVCLFTAAPIAKVKYELIAIKALPFIAMEIAVLMLITYIPEIILVLPRLAGLA